MAEPFVFHFRRAEDGHPEQMYLADVRAECTLCGHPQVQRFYHATRLHPVRTAQLANLAREVAEKTGYDCPNCGSAVGPEGCIATALTWAFPDDAGLIRGFRPQLGDAAPVLWQFVPGRRLDPQELPGWEPDTEHDWPVVDDLSDEVVEEVFGRPINPKEVIAEVLSDWAEDPAGGALARICEGMYLIAEGPEAPLAALADEVREETLAELTELRLDAAPVGLPTHREPQAISGRIGTWLRSDLLEKVDRVRMLIETEIAIATLERAFNVANLRHDTAGEGANTVFSALTSPRDERYPRDLPIRSVLARAVYTGLTPGDAARLTAEEIVGTMLRVW